jgi:hypothetical protein
VRPHKNGGGLEYASELDGAAQQHLDPDQDEPDAAEQDRPLPQRSDVHVADCDTAEVLDLLVLDEEVEEVEGEGEQGEGARQGTQHRPASSERGCAVTGEDHGEADHEQECRD